MASREAVLQLLKECLDEGGPIVDRYRRVGAVNERFVRGDQFGGLVWKKSQLEITDDAWADDEGLPRLHVNTLRNLLLVWTSLLTKNRPGVLGVAATDEPGDTWKANVANRLIEHLVYELEVARKLHDVVKVAGQDGTSAMKVVYLAAEDRVSWEPLTIHDFVLDPAAPDDAKARWVVFAHYLSEDEAEEAFEAARAAGVPGLDRPPSKKGYKNAAGEELKGVEAFELWLKPCRRYPDGLFAFVVDGEPVEVTPYPYVFETPDGKPEALLPIVLMTTRRVRGSIYGETNFTDAVPLQRGLNEIVARLMKAVRYSHAHLVIPKELLDTVDPMTSSILSFERVNTEAAAQIRWTEPPPVSEVLFNFRDYFRGAMHEVVGLNEITSGAKSRSISGVAIENTVELDAQKNADASKSLEVLTLRAWRLTLALVARFYTAPRKVRITAASAVDVLEFSGADIAGVDIRLEPSSDLNRMQQVRAAGVEEKQALGLAGPDDMARATNAPQLGLSRDLAERLVADYLAGANVDIRPEDVRLDVLNEVIEKHKARALTEGRREDYVALAELQRQLPALEAEAQQATGAPPPADELVPEAPPPPTGEIPL